VIETTDENGWTFTAVLMDGTTTGLDALGRVMQLNVVAASPAIGNQLKVPQTFTRRTALVGLSPCPPSLEPRPADWPITFSTALHPLPGDWPVPRRKGWLAAVNLPADEQEETMIRDAIKRNRPVGREARVEQTAVAGGPGAVPATPRPPGRMAQTRGSEWERHLTVRGTFISFDIPWATVGQN
jgi:hypothetical protein